MRTKLLTACLFLCMVFPVLVYGQARQISGTVTNQNGEPVPAATVLVKGTSNGVSADESGRFTINVTGNNSTNCDTALGAFIYEWFRRLG